MPHLDGDGAAMEAAHLLPEHQDHVQGSVPAEEITKVALRLKYQVETVVPVELDQERITRALSPTITPHVVETAKKAGGTEYGDCVVYCLLICKSWFIRQSKIELWDADLHEARALACEVIAKKM